VSTVKEQTIPYFDAELPKLGLEVVYRGLYQFSTTVDFTSYFALAEESKTEVLFTILPSISRSAALINEWYERQSPMLLCGDIYGVSNADFWNTTQGRTEFVLTKTSAVTLGYPLTSKVVPAKEAFLKRWGMQMKGGGASAYDIVRFILPDAIKRAGTTETEAVIKALETTSIETTMAKRFSFTSDHDMLVEEADLVNLAKSSMLYIVMQWQDGIQVPIFPEALRIEAGATYKFPPWPGAWDNISKP
jgi:ABC-type branched-subunit amino acid transport system substrate-binding protein